MAIRESLLAISPPWLQSFWSSRVQYTYGLALDSVTQWMIEGVKASLPGLGTPDAMYLIGRDRNLDRGPSETDVSFSSRLSAAFDTWATAGAAPTLLRQLAVYFAPLTTTPIRVVSNSATWHTINLSTGIVTLTASAGNWTWDALASTQWFRGWVILDSTVAPWTPDFWGTGNYGDGGTWGSSASFADVSAIRSIVDKWRPANIAVPSIIVTFSSTILLPGSSAPPNPNGTSDTPAWRTGVNAIFWGPL